MIDKASLNSLRAPFGSHLASSISSSFVDTLAVDAAIVDDEGDDEEADEEEAEEDEDNCVFVIVVDDCDISEDEEPKDADDILLVPFSCSLVAFIVVVVAVAHLLLALVSTLPLFPLPSPPTTPLLLHY